MFTLKNPEITSNWFVDLAGYNEIGNDVPQNTFNIRNDSSQIAYVDLGGRKVGEVQRFSADSFSGRGFDDFRVYNPDGGEFSAGEIFVQVSKGMVMTSQPFNPQWDMLEDDLDRFATGCDDRITFSSLINIIRIKYWVNTQNSIIVQRKLDVLGGAALGYYEIDFSGDIISGSTPVNFPVIDIIRKKKTISDGSFTYTLTNCNIKGWMIDLKLHPDISESYSLVSDVGGNGSNAYDNDMGTSAHYEQMTATAGRELWEVSFSSRTIKELHYALLLRADGNTGESSTIYFQAEIGGVWETLQSLTRGISGYIEEYHHVHDMVVKNEVTGFRLLTVNQTQYTNTEFYLWDISAFV